METSLYRGYFMELFCAMSLFHGEAILRKGYFALRLLSVVATLRGGNLLDATLLGGYMFEATFYGDIVFSIF